MIAPGAAPPGAVGDPTTPHRVLRGVLQPGDKQPARTPAQITSGKAGYHLGLAMLCLTHWIQRRWPPTGTVPCIWAIPTAHTKIEAGPDTRPNSPPRPQHSLTCGYHAIHRVLSRVGPRLELAYPLPTTDQEVQQIRKLVCEILAAAEEDGKLLLHTAWPTTDHASAPRRADIYTDTTHSTAQSPPMPLPSRCSAGDPNTPTIACSPGPRDTGLPHPPEHQHTPATDPPTGQPSPPPTLSNPHTPAERSPCAPWHAHPTQWPTHAPRTHPRRPRTTPLRP